MTTASYACWDLRDASLATGSVHSSRPTAGYLARVEIWFNPGCSKCRAARSALDEAGITYQLRYYLDEPPDEAELRATLEALGLEPWDITRTGEPLAAELGVADMQRDAEAWIALLVANPSLIQRPIMVTTDGQAWVARDPESVETAITAERT
jgi:arsenate reductase